MKLRLVFGLIMAVALATLLFADLLRRPVEQGLIVQVGLLPAAAIVRLGGAAVNEISQRGSPRRQRAGGGRVR